MDFRDYAAKETAALFTRLLASQTEASVQHLRSLREAFDAATRSIEDAGTATPEADQDLQELIRRLNTAAGTAAKVAAQRVQKEAQAVLEGVQADLDAQRGENERLTSNLVDAQAQSDALREQLQKETERAESLDRDLDAAIEAHAHVDASRVEAEAELRKQSAARAEAEKISSRAVVCSMPPLPMRRGCRASSSRYEAKPRS